MEISAMNFEDAMSELEAIVRRLEEGKTSLEDAIKHYERGSALRKHCEMKLQDAKLRIENMGEKNECTTNTVAATN